MLGSMALALALALSTTVLSESVTLDSSILEEKRELTVHLPAGHAESKERYPVVYVLDAKRDFERAVKTMDALAQAGEAPAAVVVGIVSTADRVRDFTPMESEAMPGSGASDNFMAFLRTEVFPYVEGHFRGSQERFLVGYELGGLFAVNTIVNTPGEFRGYVAISPALDFEDGYVLKRARYAFIRRAPELRYLYMSLANEEAPRSTQFDELETILKNVPKEFVTWRAERFTDEEPEASIADAMKHGLQLCFESWKAAREKD